jgi:transportin-3
MDDFVRCVTVITSPVVDAGSRKAADQWLVALRQQPQSWTIARDALAAPGGRSDVRLCAAQLLAWKVKHSLGEVPPDQQPALVAWMTELLLESMQHGDSVVGRALCVALANLAIQLPDWTNPLESLGRREMKGPVH